MKSSKSHYDISLQQVSLHYDISMDGWDGMGWDGMDVCIYSAIIKMFKTQIKIMGVLETTHYLLIKKIVHYCSFSSFFFKLSMKEAVVLAVLCFCWNLTYSISLDQEMTYFVPLYLFYKVVYPMPCTI